MTFLAHDGKLIECTNFADFYHWVTQREHLRPCPNCGYQMDMRMYPSFNMLKYGKAVFTCTNDDCNFSKDPLKIEATGGYPNGLEVIRFGPTPGNH